MQHYLEDDAACSLDCDHDVRGMWNLRHYLYMLDQISNSLSGVLS